MNRQDRRKHGVTEKQATYNISRDQLQTIKHDATKEAVERAFFLMLAVPVYTMYNMQKKNWNDFIKSNVLGKSRIERFADQIVETYDAYDRGYITFDDLKNVLEQEAGMNVPDARG